MSDARLGYKIRRTLLEHKWSGLLLEADFASGHYEYTPLLPLR